MGDDGLYLFIGGEVTDDEERPYTQPREPLATSGVKMLVAMEAAEANSEHGTS